VILALFNDTFSIALWYRITVDSDMETMCKETVMSCFEVLFQYLLGGTDLKP
jgi:hypothetical protein